MKYVIWLVKAAICLPKYGFWSGLSVTVRLKYVIWWGKTVICISRIRLWLGLGCGHTAEICYLIGKKHIRRTGYFQTWFVFSFIFAEKVWYPECARWCLLLIHSVRIGHTSLSKIAFAAKGKMCFRKESKRKAMNGHICAIRGLSIGSLFPTWNKSVYLRNLGINSWVHVGGKFCVRFCAKILGTSE